MLKTTLPSILFQENVTGFVTILQVTISEYDHLLRKAWATCQIMMNGGLKMFLLFLKGDIYGYIISPTILRRMNQPSILGGDKSTPLLSQNPCSYESK